MLFSDTHIDVMAHMNAHKQMFKKHLNKQKQRSRDTGMNSWHIDKKYETDYTGYKPEHRK